MDEKNKQNILAPDKFLIAIMSHDLYVFPVVNCPKAKTMAQKGKRGRKFIYLLRHNQEHGI